MKLVSKYELKSTNLSTIKSFILPIGLYLLEAVKYHSHSLHSIHMHSIFGSLLIWIYMIYNYYIMLLHIYRILFVKDELLIDRIVNKLCQSDNETFILNGNVNQYLYSIKTINIQNNEEKLMRKIIENNKDILAKVEAINICKIDNELTIDFCKSIDNKGDIFILKKTTQINETFLFDITNNSVIRIYSNNIVLFTRYPEPGKTKTRLAKSIGNELAVEFHIYSLNKILQTISI
ncbi:hypothetical protein I4U23_022269 [Adineta vaga]|nr:hypothetical protein I4U23_022269 [Adineta vaga]